MIKIEKLEEKDIYTFEIEGDIDKNDADKITQLLLAENRKIKLLGIVKEIPGFEDFKSFSETLKTKMKSVSNISKYAVLTDRDWIENILPIGNFIVPSIPMKVFELDEKGKAIAWLENDVDEDDYLTEMNIDHIRGTNIYSMTIDGEIDKAGMSVIREILKKKAKNEKINLLAIVKDFEGFDDFGAFVEGLKVDVEGIGNVEKYAIVSNKK